MSAFAERLRTRLKIPHKSPADRASAPGAIDTEPTPEIPPAAEHPVIALVKSVCDSMRFALNALLYGRLVPPLSGYMIETVLLDTSGVLKEITVSDRYSNVLARMPYFETRNEDDRRLGGSVPWDYLCERTFDRRLTDRQKYRIMRCILGRLPMRVAFEFIGTIGWEDAAVAAMAFKKAGFIHTRPRTYIYEPPEIADPTPYDLVSDIPSINTRRLLRKTLRDMDVIDLSGPPAIAFFSEFYSANLVRRERESYLSMKVDRQIAEAGLSLSPPRIRILASVQKASTEPGQKPVIEAAIMVARNADGYDVLRRVSVLPSSDGFKPRQYGARGLFLACMQSALSNGSKVDTDLFNEGVKFLCERFGVWKLTTRDQFRRDRPADILNKFFPSLLRWPPLLQRMHNRLQTATSGRPQPENQPPNRVPSFP